MKQYKHIPIYPETKQKLDEIGVEVSNIQQKKSVSYDTIINHLIAIAKKHKRLKSIKPKIQS